MDKNETIAFPTWLPGFSGFYDTIWKVNIEVIAESIEDEGVFVNKYKRLMIDGGKEYIDGIIDDLYQYERYEKELAKDLCSAVADMSPLIEKIEYEDIYSPKEYNYRNDHYNCKIHVKMNKLKKWAYDNKEYLDKYFKDRYTGYDGFIPFYDNDFDGWEKNTNGFEEFDEHEIGAILDASLILEYGKYYEQDLYEEYGYKYLDGYIDTDKLLEEIKENKDIEWHFKNTDPDQLEIGVYGEQMKTKCLNVKDGKRVGMEKTYQVDMHLTAYVKANNEENLDDEVMAIKEEIQFLGDRGIQLNVHELRRKRLDRESSQKIEWELGLTKNPFDLYAGEDIEKESGKTYNELIKEFNKVFNEVVKQQLTPRSDKQWGVILKSIRETYENIGAHDTASRSAQIVYLQNIGMVK